MRSKILPIGLLVCLLQACGDEWLRQAATPAFTDGYGDGCRNGSSTASNLTGEFIRNEARYRSEPDYARGWQDGNRTCNGEALNENPYQPLEPVDIDGPP